MRFFNRESAPAEPDPDERIMVHLTPPDADGKRHFIPAEEHTMAQQTPDDQFDGGRTLSPEEYAARKQWAPDPAGLANEQQPGPADPGAIRSDLYQTGEPHEHSTSAADTGTRMEISPDELCPTCGQRVPNDAALLKASLDLLIAAGVTGQVAPYFYDQVFTLRPETRQLFPDDMEQQHEKILSAIITLVTHYETGGPEGDPEFLDRALIAMGRAHTRFNLTVTDYADVGTALLRTLAHFAGDAWTPALANAWTRAYKYLAGTMLRGEATPNRGQTGRRRRA